METKSIRRNEITYRWEVLTANGWEPLPWDWTASYEHVKRWMGNQSGGALTVRWAREQDISE